MLLSLAKCLFGHGNLTGGTVDLCLSLGLRKGCLDIRLRLIQIAFF